jgi:protoporphyrinogen oxidase
MITESKIVIIGAGPAGLTAAFELAKAGKQGIVVLEKDSQVGGISKTVNYKGNLIDIGGHRFFSKSNKVLKWWADFLPILDTTSAVEITYHHRSRGMENIMWRQARSSMLVRPRKSRIYFRRHLFDYPLKISLSLFRKLGLIWSIQVFRDIVLSRLRPIQPEVTLEHFYINRFGKKLYETFFKDYTHKVWGKPCSDISSEWGRQRVKSLGIRQIVWHHLGKVFKPLRYWQRNEARTLTEKFLYPAKGPGMMWERVYRECKKLGVQFELGASVSSLVLDGDNISAVGYRQHGEEKLLSCDAVFSTMALKDLVAAFSHVPDPVAKVGAELEYRDFIIVGLLLRQLHLTEADRQDMIRDNWLYIQEKDVKVGRLQIFNNWSPFMVSGEGSWIGAEYFCANGDDIASRSDEELVQLAVAELHAIGIIDKDDFLDGHVVRCDKAYPSYTGSYGQIGVVRQFLGTIGNLFPMGRNGLHKYNNQDHSMLTAFKAVEVYSKKVESADEIWAINSEEEYHEEVK